MTWQSWISGAQLPGWTMLNSLTLQNWAPDGDKAGFLTGQSWIILLDRPEPLTGQSSTPWLDRAQLFACLDYNSLTRHSWTLWLDGAELTDGDRAEYLDWKELSSRMGTELNSLSLSGKSWAHGWGQSWIPWLDRAELPVRTELNSLTEQIWSRWLDRAELLDWTEWNSSIRHSWTLWLDILAIYDWKELNFQLFAPDWV
jgi:hypothetical protein